MAKGGTILYGAMYPGDFEMSLNLFKYCYYNELTITGTYVALMLPRALQVLPHLDPKPFTGKSISLERVAEAYAAQMTGKYPKILIECNEGLNNSSIRQPEEAVGESIYWSTVPAVQHIPVTGVKSVCGGRI